MLIHAKPALKKLTPSERARRRLEREAAQPQTQQTNSKARERLQHQLYREFNKPIPSTPDVRGMALGLVAASVNSPLVDGLCGIGEPTPADFLPSIPEPLNVESEKHNDPC